MLFKSIKSQVLFVLFVQIIILIGIVVTTVYLLNLRQHDYLILNLAGQLRVIAQTMVSQSENYATSAPRDYASYYRDLGLYHRDLKTQIVSFERIVKALKERSVSADLVEASFSKSPSAAMSERTAVVPSLVQEPVTLVCRWNEQSRQQMSDTAQVWEEFRQGLQASLGDDHAEPRLEYAANYILEHGQTLTNRTAELASGFRKMMEHKMMQIKVLNQGSVLMLVLVSLTIVFILYKRIFKPIDTTVQGFHRVSSGELSYQIPIQQHNEIGVMTDSFNQLTRRLSALFRLTGRINEAENLDDTLRYVFEEFPEFLPVDWVGLLRSSKKKSHYHLDRRYSQQHHDLGEQEYFDKTASVFEESLDSRSASCSGTAMSTESLWQNDPFINRLQDNGLLSIFYLPLLTSNVDEAVLVFAASQPDCYDTGHIEFLTNIAEQVGHSVEKTIGMESLVISTVKGLAKLAESRDPETGDHLFRMSHYSAMIAEELAETAKYREVIDAAYVRDILQFAPMHDIGKVGINDDILLKPGRLNELEMQAMQQHPLIGGQVLQHCEEQMNEVGRSVFKIGIEIAEAHHEKYDGSGYPRSLEGEAIPLSARIVALADVFDALTSKRPYKQAWQVDDAIALIHAEAGRHFDPEVVQAFNRCLPRILSLYEKHKHV